MNKILFVASHRMDRAPGQRFRFEQYFDFLEENGFECELSYLISEEDDQMLYRKGDHFNKMRFVRNCYKKRRSDLARINEFDIVFIFREALMTRSMFFEKKFAESSAKLVFDFDDAVWLSNVSDANRRWKWMKNPKKTSVLIALSDLIFAGNQYLADYASTFNRHVQIIPTTINTAEYQRMDVERNDRICIGWSGSITTIQHFRYAIPFLMSIKAKYGDKVMIKVIGDANFEAPELDVKGIGWKRETEIAELSRFDIGIMPLPDDEWAKGKCGLKGLQYMALGIPTIMSPVGVNTEIIQDGVNGALATTTKEWEGHLSRLIEDDELRRRIGNEARKTVVEKYSVDANKNKYLKAFQELLGQNDKKE